GVHGTLYNIVAVDNRFGDSLSAIKLTGSQSYVKLPNDPSLKPQFPVAVSFWIRLSSYPSVHQNIIKSDDIATSYAGYWLTLNPQGEIVAGYGNNLGVGHQFRRTKNPINATVPLNDWVHVVASFNGYNAVDLYYNGVKQQGSYSGLANSMGYSSAFGTIGKYTYSGGIRYINAEIDDVRIYSDTLDDRDVGFMFYQLPCNETIYDTIPLIDTITTNITVYDTVSVFDTTVVQKLVTQYDTVAIANTLIINYPLSIDESKVVQIKVYPNPTRDKLYLDFGDEYGKLEDVNIKLFTSSGQKVYDRSIENPFEYVDLSSIKSSGVYFIQLRDDKGELLLSQKLIIQ
ncbi:MAG: T9SS type A sorting domain-containing protein, partial [Schleiferiaceae bacterium]|nr:T9SS type A sorting domain-containing protein [Schleiferiaceae bacterium]